MIKVEIYKLPGGWRWAMMRGPYVLADNGRRASTLRQMFTDLMKALRAHLKTEK